MIRVGLLVDQPHRGPSLDALLDWVSGQAGITLDHLIVCRLPADAAPAGDLHQRFADALRSLRTWPFRLLATIERRSLERDAKPPLTAKDRQLARRYELTLRPGTPGKFVADPLDVSRVNALGLDVILRCGGVPLEGPILQAARIATLALPGEGAPGEGDAALGFWEVYRGQHYGWYQILRLNPYGEPTVVCSGSARTRYLFLLNRLGLVARCYGQLRWLLPRLAAGQPLPVVAALPMQPAVPGPWHVAGYVLRVGLRRTINLARRLMRRELRWSVAYYPGPWHALEPRKLRPIPSPPGTFLADPVVIEQGGRVVCFVEEYVYRQQRGRIAAYELNPEGPRPLGTALEEPFHLSFPYLFRFRGELYMCPECCEARQLRIYRCREFPLHWELAEVPMEDVHFVDPVIFEHEGRWWLLANHDYAGDGEYCSELDLFSADTPLGAKWTPHPMNPIQVDADGARNGGILIDGDRIFRPAQRHGFELYGRGLAIKEIVRLTPSAYAETGYRLLGPEDFPGTLGLHHMTSCGKVTVIDRQTMVWVGRES